MKKKTQNLDLDLVNFSCQACIDAVNSWIETGGQERDLNYLHSHQDFNAIYTALSGTHKEKVGGLWTIMLRTFRVEVSENSEEPAGRYRKFLDALCSVVLGSTSSTWAIVELYVTNNLQLFASTHR